ncbi:hypothetical protein H6504_02280 [Candidatus Woesearchaeota archaeon]|nr:hypothetical protein [Candidatus Woesearchaeota archaeon]
MIDLIITIIVMILAAIPLNIAAKMLGGDSSIWKAVFVNLLYGLAVFFLTPVLQSSLGSWTPLILFIINLFLFRAMFDVGWLRAFLIWIAQFLILILLVVLLIMLGISLPFLLFL